MHGRVVKLFSAAVKHDLLQRWITWCATSIYIHYTIATLYFGEIGACSMRCQKLVIAHKYSAEVWPNCGTHSTPSAKTSASASASAEHYKGMFGAPLIWCGTGSQWNTSWRAGVMCSYLPTLTTRRAAAFRTIWSWRMTCEETPYRTPLQ